MLGIDGIPLSKCLTWDLYVEAYTPGSSVFLGHITFGPILFKSHIAYFYSSLSHMMLYGLLLI